MSTTAKLVGLYIYIPFNITFSSLLQQPVLPNVVDQPARAHPDDRLGHGQSQILRHRFDKLVDISPGISLSHESPTLHRF